MKLPWPLGQLGLKSLSIGIALLLWVFVAGDETVERGLRVPLELQQFPDGIEMVGEAPSLIDVRVRGGSATLSQLGTGDIVAQLDLKAARIGRRLYQLTPEQVRVPFGVQVVQVAPPTVALTFEPSISRMVPVVPDVAGDPLPGFVVGDTTIDPPEVEVTGPQSAVQRVTEAVTETISVADAKASVRERVTIGLLDSAVRLKTPRLADVVVQVIPGPVERTLNDRPVRLHGATRGVTVSAEPRVVDVVLRGSREGVSRVEADDVVASIDVSGLGVGTYTLPVHVESPARAGVARILPATVQVSIGSGRK